MSHRPTCPDPYTARREGERAADVGDGRWRNPYRDECPDAERDWDRGYEAERDRIEERQAEERHARRVREEQQAEEAYWEEQQRLCDADTQREYDRMMAAEYAAYERAQLWDLYVYLLHGI